MSSGAWAQSSSPIQDRLPLETLRTGLRRMAGRARAGNVTRLSPTSQEQKRPGKVERLCSRGVLGDVEQSWTELIEWDQPRVPLAVPVEPGRSNQMDSRSEEHTSELQSR